MFSELRPKGEAVRPTVDAERDSLPFGEFDLEYSCDARVVLAVDAARLAPRKGRLAVDVCGDSSLSDSLVFGTWSGVAAAERGGGDWTGSPSCGDVMDLAQGGMCKCREAEL